MSDYLKNIAERMKRDARARMGAVIRPSRPLANGAHLAMKYLGSSFFLRIGRKGLSPENDFSDKANRRRAAWNNEVKTFLRDFGAGDDVQISQGAAELFYYADCLWADVVRQEGNSNGDVQTRAANVARANNDLGDSLFVGE